MLFHETLQAHKSNIKAAICPIKDPAPVLSHSNESCEWKKNFYNRIEIPISTCYKGGYQITRDISAAERARLQP